MQANANADNMPGRKSPVGHNKVCLIVDDSRVIRVVARTIIQSLGFVTEEAGDGQSALILCGTRMPDAVFLDWNMPVMNGIQFLRALRAMPGGGNPVVILCTTENDPEHIVEALAAGANEYVMKPFDNEIIQAKFVMTGLIAPQG